MTRLISTGTGNCNTEVPKLSKVTFVGRKLPETAEAKAPEAKAEATPQAKAETEEVAPKAETPKAESSTVEKAANPATGDSEKAPEA